MHINGNMMGIEGYVMRSDRNIVGYPHPTIPGIWAKDDLDWCTGASKQGLVHARKTSPNSCRYFISSRFFGWCSKTPNTGIYQSESDFPRPCGAEPLPISSWLYVNPQPLLTTVDTPHNKSSHIELLDWNKIAETLENIKLQNWSDLSMEIEAEMNLHKIIDIKSCRMLSLNPLEIAGTTTAGPLWPSRPGPRAAAPAPSPRASAFWTAWSPSSRWLCGGWADGKIIRTGNPIKGIY